ncbi:MAG: hemerythrin family protein [Aquificae bacterium]|nr:hemerythrin family protein [Aquificota bacterium]
MLLEKDRLPLVVFSPMNEVHLRELEVLNDLYEAAKKGNPERTAELLEAFLADVESHFSFEEGLMEKTRFFAYPVHKAEHDRIRDELNRLRKEWEERRDPSAVAEYLKTRFVPWLLEHLQTMDAVTAQYLLQFSSFLK